MIKIGKIFKAIFCDYNGDMKYGYHQLFYSNYPKNNKWKNIRLRLTFDRIYWEDHYVDVKFKFIANLYTYKHCFTLLRG